VDCTRPGHRLVVEVDSWRYHRARDAFDRMLDRKPTRVAARVRRLLAATAATATAPGGP
jgi:hypothetical protein